MGSQPSALKVFPSSVAESVLPNDHWTMSQQLNLSRIHVFLE